MTEATQKFKKLTPMEMREKLPRLPGWNISNGRLEKEFRFENFAKTMLFLNKIMNPIEEHQNYPRMTIVYDRVLISLFTGMVGALTELDFEMAEEFNRLGGVKVPETPEPGLIKA